jgi:tRNA G18 (ribose-2'-O)-methylase SpoU
MFQLHHVPSLDLPELAPYRTMRRPAGHVEQRIFIAEGEKLVRRLLVSDFEVVSVVLPEHRLAEFEALLAARPENIPVYIVPKAELEKLVGFDMYQGVIAVSRFPTPRPLAEILQASPRPWLLVALDELASAENLGVIVRNCAAFGVHALIAGETCTSPYMRRSVRNSMGSIFKLPVVEPPSLVATLRELRALGVKCLATHLDAKSLTLACADLRGDTCIVLGSEGHGLSDAVLAACDEAVSIPMANDVDSLNVGNAAAVFLYEAARQRGRM